MPVGSGGRKRGKVEKWPVGIVGTDESGQWMAPSGAARERVNRREEEKREREKVSGWVGILRIFFTQVSKNYWVEIPTHVS